MTTFLIRIVFLAAALAVTPPAATANAKERPTAPDWQLKDLSGQTIKSSDYKGKVVVLNFWATWCGPCRAEIPGFVKLQKQYGPKGLTFIGVSMDEGGTKAVAAFVKQARINYPIVMGDAKTAFLYGGIEYIPATFVIDRAGRVIALNGSFTDLAALEALIKPLL